MDKSELTSFGLITTYMLKAKAKHTGMMDMKAIEKAMRLAPYFDMYLEQAEKVLRKPRQQFTDDEKDIIKREIYKAYIQSRPLNNINTKVMLAIKTGLDRAQEIINNRKE
jgi:hypothetical protein